MILSGKATHEIQLLNAINSWAGNYPAIDTFMRLLTVFGVLPLMIIAMMIATCAIEPRRRRGGWITLAGAFLAFIATLGVQEVMYRSRPFLSHPIRLLVCYPNDAFFPSLQMAAGAALALGLFAYSPCLRWGIPIYMGAAGLARLFCGVEYPVDVLGAWFLGGLSTSIVIFLWDYDFLVESEDWKRLVGVGIAILCATFFLAFRLPQAGIRPQLSTYTPKVLTVSTEDKNLIKGFSPDIEWRIAQALVKRRLPGPIRKVAVGGNNFIRVAAVKFTAGTETRPMPRFLIEKQALEIIRIAFKVAPEIKEVDVWGVLPYRNEAGQQALKVVFSVEAQRKDAAFLLTGQPLKVSGRQALGRFGLIYYKP